jgi:pyruvate/2-oxoglutarate dehydrogenase complex dihydrolipoamide acyltransferase (E2) component
MNAFIDYSPVKNGGTLYHAEDVNLGITVHTKYGVVRPVLRNGHLKTLEQVATELRDLTHRARRTDPEELYRGAAFRYLLPSLKELDVRALYPGFLLARELLFPRWKPDAEYRKIPADQKLKVEDILGVTCSIANIGMMTLGHQTVTALAPPEVMMFGLGDIHEAPRVVDGAIVPRHVMTICATMDHRAYDAGEAFPFGKYLLKYFAHPELIYEWKPGDTI